MKTGSISEKYSKFAHIADHGQSVFLLIVRLYIGYQCAMAGYHHLVNYQKTVDAFKGWQVPFPKISVGVAATTELVGGALLFLGLAARLVSIPLLFNFLVAMHATQGSELTHFWNHMDDIISDGAFPYFITAALILFFGPGLFSIDRLIKKCARPAAKPA